jgi:hypothetical protein
MLHESVQNFKAAPVKLTTLVLEEKAETALLDGKVQLTLPRTTGIIISRVSGQEPFTWPVENSGIRK